MVRRIAVPRSGTLHSNTPVLKNVRMTSDANQYVIHLHSSLMCGVKRDLGMKRMCCAVCIGRGGCS